jgi:putative transposase
MCRLYGVTRAGFYAWRKRLPSERERTNQVLLERISAIHRASHKTYGSPRVHRALRSEGHSVGKHRVAHLMRTNRLRARQSTLYRANPANHAFFTSVPNRQLKMLAKAPDQVWVGDITYLKVGTDWRYLAVVMDKCTRRIVGWSLGKQKSAALTQKALDRAVHNRRPKPGLIFHSDRGIEYAAHSFRQRLADLGITQSMNRPCRMNDNAHMESFFHSMKADAFHGRRFDEDEALKQSIQTYMPFYNHTRLHSALNYVSPATYEQALAQH